MNKIEINIPEGFEIDNEKFNTKRIKRNSNL